MYSLIIPVYKNEASIPELLEVVTRLNATSTGNSKWFLSWMGALIDHTNCSDKASQPKRRIPTLGPLRNFESIAAIGLGWPMLTVRSLPSWPQTPVQPRS